MPKLGILLLPMVVGACGYEPVYSSERPAVRLSVEAAPHGTPHLEAVHAALTGMRRSLSRAGVLRPGSGYPKVVVEVLRVDEQAAGIQSVDLPASGAIPLARGSAVGVVGRAWVEEGANSSPTRDTGNVRRVEHYGSASDPRVEQLYYGEAVRAAAHSLGEALGRRILGEPETTLEPM